MPDVAIWHHRVWPEDADLTLERRCTIRELNAH